MEIDWWTIMCLIPFLIFLIGLFAWPSRCDDPLDQMIIGEADGYQFRRCQCLHKGHTYRCAPISNNWESFQYFFQIGRFKEVDPIYHFKAETMGLT